MLVFFFFPFKLQMKCIYCEKLKQHRSVESVPLGVPSSWAAQCHSWGVHAVSSSLCLLSSSFVVTGYKINKHINLEIESSCKSCSAAWFVFLTKYRVRMSVCFILFSVCVVFNSEVILSFCAGAFIISKVRNVLFPSTSVPALNNLRLLRISF